MTEFRPGRFQILPTIVKNLIIINVLVFIAQKIFDSPFASFDLNNLFALHTIQSAHFHVWQIVTYMFMHGSIDHIFFNMFALWMFGSILENTWGEKKFLTFYMLCGIGAALCHLAVLYYENQPLVQDLNLYNLDLESHSLILQRLDVPTIGASGAIFGCLAAFGYLFPNTYIYLYFFIPLKAKWFVIIYGVIELFGALRNSAGDDVAHFAHLGGALVGIILCYIWNKKKKNRYY